MSTEIVEVSTATNEHILQEISKIRLQNNTITTQNNEIKKDLNELKISFTSMQSNVDQCKSDITEIKKALDFNEKQFEDHKGQQDNIIKSHKEINSRLDKMQNQLNLTQKRLLEETLVRNNNENHSRKINIEISGIPVLHNENCKDIVAKIAQKFGVPFKSEDIDVAHRLFQKDTSQTPSIIARFKSRSERDLFYSKRSNLKFITVEDLGFTPVSETSKSRNKIFINESLSIYSKQLFKASREKSKSKGYEYCFVNGGVVYVKKDKESSKHRINSFGDLERIFEV